MEDKRRSKNAKRVATTSILADIRAEVGEGRSKFIEYLYNITQNSSKDTRQGALGCVKFLRWLGRADATAAETAILKALQHGEPVVGSDNAPAFRTAVQSWIDVYTDPGCDDEALSTASRCRQALLARNILAKMALEGVRGVPANFRKHFIAVREGKEHSEPTPTLGDLEIYADLGSDSLSRSKAALAKLRSSYVEAFMYHEALYRFGRAVATGSLPQPDSSAEACAVLREHILTLEDWLRREGRFPGSNVVRPSRPGRLPLCGVKTWLEAGFDPRPLVQSYGEDCESFKLALRGCIGPTQHAAAAVMGVLLCDTGWNEQPLIDLERYPYAFVSSDHGAIATSSFIQGFKRRAGHAVVGYLDEGSLVAGTRLELARQAWEHTRQEHDSTDQCDGYAMLHRNVVGESSAYEVLERYRSMAEEFRARAGSKVNAVFGNSLWINMTFQTNLKRFSTTRGLRLMRNHPMFPPKVGWRVIRTTFIAIHREETGSMAATQTVAGHYGTSTIIPHYFNTPAVARKLDGDIRDFQEAVQAVLLFDEHTESVAFKMALTPEKLAELRRFADASGITQILGLGPKTLPQGLDGEFVFTPTDENLQDLFLVLKAIRREQAFSLNRERFRHRILPMFVFVKALRRKLFQENLGRSYLTAARTALRRLNAGHIVLPALGYQNG